MKYAIIASLISTTAMAGSFDGTYALSKKYCETKTRAISGDAKSSKSVSCSTMSMIPFYDAKVPSATTKLWIVQTDFCTGKDQVMTITKSNKNGWTSMVEMEPAYNAFMKFNVNFKDNYPFENFVARYSADQMTFSGSFNYADEFQKEKTENKVIIQNNSDESIKFQVKRTIDQEFFDLELNKFTKLRKFEETVDCNFPKIQ